MGVRGFLLMEALCALMLLCMGILCMGYGYKTILQLYHGGTQRLRALEAVQNYIECLALPEPERTAALLKNQMDLRQDNNNITIETERLSHASLSSHLLKITVSWHVLDRTESALFYAEGYCDFSS